MPVKDEHSSLLQTLINLAVKSFITLGPGSARSCLPCREQGGRPCRGYSWPGR